MKNYLLGIMTVLIVALMSFKSIEDVFFVKPAVPKQVFFDTRTQSDDLRGLIFQKHKEGFIVKSVAYDNQYGKYVVIMEKY